MLSSLKSAREARKKTKRGVSISPKLSRGSGSAAKKNAAIASTQSVGDSHHLTATSRTLKIKRIRKITCKDKLRKI